MPRRKPAPIHPGEFLLEEFLIPLGISQYRLAEDISVPRAEFIRWCEGNVRLQRTPLFDGNVSFRQLRGFGLTCRRVFDLELEKDRPGDRLEREVATFAVQQR